MWQTCSVEMRASEKSCVCFFSNKRSQVKRKRKRKSRLSFINLLSFQGEMYVVVLVSDDTLLEDLPSVGYICFGNAEVVYSSVSY